MRYPYFFGLFVVVGLFTSVHVISAAKVFGNQLLLCCSSDSRESLIGKWG